jgi:hypothetical protein
MLDALTKSGTTSTSVIKKNNHFKLFPVPAKDVLFFSADGFNGAVKFEIWDIAGRLQKSFKLESTEIETITIDISGVKSGLYLLSVTNRDRIFTSKFLVE